jgi:ABC-2 type transport system ATP-binding protein
MIEALNLFKIFGDFVAVSDVTFTVGEGEVVVLLGPNGAGKTTTVRMLAGILRPTRGRAVIAGHDVSAEPIAVREIVGLLTELPGLYDRMTALDYLHFFGALQGLSPARQRERAEQLLRRLEIWEARRLRLGEYSKGMRQKVALARAILHDPPVLLLDEPTSAMDPGSARLVRESIAELKQAGRTLFICTHNLTEAELLADRIAIIRSGKIIALDTARRLRRQLLGAALMEVRLNGPLDGFLPALQDLVPVAGHGPTWLRYLAPEPEALNPLVLRRLGELGAEVVTLSEVTQGLEEVYLSIVSAGEEALSETASLLQRRGEQQL